MIFINGKVCPRCNEALGKIEYKGVYICECCYTNIRLYENMFNNKKLQDNTFIVKKNGKEYIGTIIGYQHKIGSVNDKFFVYLDVNEDDFSIWFNDWMTEEELIRSCEKYKINIEKLLK